MFNMQVSRYEDNLKLGSTYRLEWVCDGKKVGYQVLISHEEIYGLHDSHMAVRMHLRSALRDAIFDLHKDNDCEWCKNAAYGLEIVFKNDDAGAKHPTPFWKMKHPAVSTGQVYIGKPGGEDTEWQTLGYTTWQTLGYTTKNGLEFYSGEAITAESGTFAKLDGASMLAQKSHELPGIDCWVRYPCSCTGQGRLRKVIMHLNDNHKWTREAIADWLTEIDDPYGDGPDLAFKVPE